jgi:2-polyprenyl-3-methyl-5-hydroxy-6-metoxy-1,4-benzoquinol methylase
VAQGQTTASALAGACGADARGTRILCDYLVVIGFLTKQNQIYGLTPETAMFLNRDSPAYMGGAIEFMLAPQITDGFKDVAAAVRKGGTVMPDDGTLGHENPVWVKFAQAMLPMMAMPAQLLAKLVDGEASTPLMVLDIAAGHGIFGIAFAQQNSNAHIVALDWPNVLAVAQANAQSMGVADRYSTIPGSAFEVDFNGPYNVILLTNFLHHFDVVACESLLQKTRASLVEGGRAVILDFIPNEDRVSPPIPAAFAMTMLGSTPHGDVYTPTEYETMCRNAGFARSQFHPLPPSPQQAVIAYR